MSGPPVGGPVRVSRVCFTWNRDHPGVETTDRMSAMIKSADGYTYSGTLWRGPAPKPTFAVGLSPNPSTYTEWFGKMAPAVPQFARVFAPPGHGLPVWTGAAISSLPHGCLPWVSHKDPVPIDVVTAYWAAMPGASDGTTKYRWTYHHEAAPADDDFRKAYFGYWRDLQAAAVNFPGIELVQIQSNYAMRWRTDTDWRAWIVPGVSVGFDCYPLMGFRYEPPESMFGLLQYAAAIAEAPSWGVPELGADVRTGQNRGRWLQDCVDYVQGHGGAYVGLWCTQDPNSGLDYRPTDAPTLAVYRELLA